MMESCSGGINIKVDLVNLIVLILMMTMVLSVMMMVMFLTLSMFMMSFSVDNIHWIMINSRGNGWCDSGANFTK
jgi:hypothetical protein